MVRRLKVFFAQLFLLISSVFTEQSQICVMKTVPVKQERGDMCWQNNLTHYLSQQVCWWKHLHFRPKILRKKIYCKSTKNEWKGSHNKIVWFFLYWYRILDNSWSRTVLHDKGHWIALTINRISRMSWVHLTTRWKIIWPERLDSREHQIGPVLEVTTSYLQGKHGVEIRIESVNKDNSHSWVRISHGLNKLVTDLSNKEDDDNEQETSEMKFEEFALKTNVLALRADQRLKQTHEDVLLLINMNCTYRWKILDWYWARNLFVYRLPSVKTIEYSSSSWWSTSRRRWSYWILEIKRLSSERIWVLSTLVWWNVEESNVRRRRQEEKISILYWSIRTRNSLSPSSSRSFRTQFHWSFTTRQHVLIPNNFFEYLYHIGCAINLHPITNSGLIPGGQNLGRGRQTVFFTAVNPMDKEHKVPYKLDLTKPRLA